MRRSSFLAAACILAVVVGVGVGAQQPPAPSAADSVKAATEALGVEALKVARYSAFGANFSVGQSPSADEPWPRVTVKSYEAVIDFQSEAMRVELTREQGPVPPRGGGQPFVGEQTQIQFVRGNLAWNVAPPAAGAGRGGRRGGGPGPADPNRLTANEANLLIGVRPPGPPPPTPQPNAVVDRRVQMYLTPHGFLKGAAANNATSRTVQEGTEVAFTLDGKYKFTGVINRRNEVSKVTALVDNPVLGDMPIVATYSNYQTFDEGVMFPLRIVQTAGGHPSYDLWVSAVAINPQPSTFQDPRNAPRDEESVNFEVPESVRAATVPPVNVTNEELGPGIQYLRGGSHHSVAIEMRDHVVLVEAPQDEARASAVIAKTKELFPNKPIRYVVNTHHHFDHSGGLRTAVADGATVVTHRSNQAFYRDAWSKPRTINPDRLAEMPRTPRFVPVAERHVLTDGARSIQIHRIAGNPHNDGFLMVYLPTEKILIEADAYTPPAPPAAGQGGRAGGAPAAAEDGGGRAGGAPAAGGRGGRAGGAPAPPPVNPSTKNLLENIERLKLDVAQIAALHGNRLATMDDLRTAVNPPAPAPAPAAPAGGAGRGGA
jgi:glyoxylase-like metal-dependent hydrolase (beta-lactamase superfamily II)